VRLRYRILLLLALGLLASACRGELSLDIQVLEDGSGAVTFTVFVDDDFVDQFGSLDELVLDDVLAAGWTVEVSSVAGGEEVQATKPFAKMADLAVVVGELDSQADGLFQNVQLVRIEERDLVRFELSMQLDLSQLVEQLSDGQLTDRLDGRPFGFEPADLDRLAGGSVEAATSVTVSVDLAGTSFETGGTLESAEVIPILVTTEIPDKRALQLRADAESSRNLASVFGLLLIPGLFVFWLVVRRREDPSETWYDEHEFDPDDSEMAYAPTAEGESEAADSSQPTADEVWVDGVGWVDGESLPEPDPEEFEMADEEPDVPAPDTTEIPVLGGSVSFRAPAGDDADETADDPGDESGDDSGDESGEGHTPG
jgi:hypothetical protein